MDLLSWALVVAVFAPLVTATLVGLASLLLEQRPGERAVFTVTAVGLVTCIAADAVVILAGVGALGPAARASMIAIGHPAEVDR